jgi:hypothetical protein
VTVDVRRSAGRGLAALALAACVLSGAAAMAQSSTPRLVVMDMPYARVWDGAVQALGSYGVERASDGLIETSRAERAPRPAEKGMERVAERVSVRVEAVGEKVTRVTVTVAAEALKDGRWQAVDASPDTARAVLDRIRATLG